MYKEFFGLSENPFSITPDPRYVFMSTRHEDALGHLLYGVGDSGGFVMLTGEVGTGKTTLCRCLLERLPDEVDIALILNPRLDALELLAAVCDELGVGYEPENTASRKALVDRLNGHLLEAHAKGRRSVLIIDEAQNLEPDVLEQVRLLTNLETPTRKLLQIILVGQPELKDILAREDMRQLSQRITARFHLDELSESETAPYIRHRLAVAGLRDDVFTPGAFAEAHRLSGGVPRLINTICDRAMLAAYSRDKRVVDPALVAIAATEVLGTTEPPPRTKAANKTPPPRDGNKAGWLSFAAVVLLGIGFALLDPLKLELIPDPIRDRIDRHLQPILGQPVLSNTSEPASGDAGTTSQQPQDRMTSPAATDRAEGVPTTAAQELDFLEIPSTPDQSYETLFALWGETLDGTSPACDQAPGVNLACFEWDGGWEAVRKLNLPAMIRLNTPSGGETTAVITQLSAEHARLGVGSTVVETAIDALDTIWDGRFTVVWRPPPFHTRVLKMGMEGQDVAWLKLRMAELDGLPLADGQSPRYDLTLADRISRFQAAQGLTASGIAGPETLIRLDAELYGQSGPGLTPGPGL